MTSRRMRARVAENSLNGIEFQDEKLTPRLGIGRWTIIRSYQITRVVHRSRISERKIYSEHVANDLGQDLSCAEFCAASGKSTRQPCRAGCTGLLVSHLLPESLPALQSHASDANTIQRQHDTRSRHADRQEAVRSANHRGGVPTQSMPREQASLVDSEHPPGRFSTKRLFCERNPASRNHPCVFIF